MDEIKQENSHIGGIPFVVVELIFFIVLLVDLPILASIFKLNQKLDKMQNVAVVVTQAPDPMVTLGVGTVTPDTTVSATPKIEKTVKITPTSEVQ